MTHISPTASARVSISDSSLRFAPAFPRRNFVQNDRLFFSLLRTAHAFAASANGRTKAASFATSPASLPNSPICFALPPPARHRRVFH